ncbi:MAG: LicD family protein [Bacteroidota bacterium]|nr:LicD family protein [Bacteroidota bacterium]
MKPLTLQELHAIDLDILKEIDAFCRPRGIRYSLSFGTLLGAVRHKGFIPWDDDIDLVMPREDYDRFRKEFTSDRFRFIDRESNPACYLTFGRVVETEKTHIASMQPWHSPAINTGAWVDIFPMDYVPDDREEYMCLYRVFNRLLKMARKVRRLAAPDDAALPMGKRFKMARRRMGHKSARKQDPSAMALDMIATARKASEVPTGHVGLLLEPTTPSYYFEKAIFEEYVDLPFEDGAFPCPVRYKEVLEACFGPDYMQLPPENRRKTDLYKLGNVYWKD